MTATTAVTRPVATALFVLDALCALAGSPDPQSVVIRQEGPTAGAQIEGLAVLGRIGVAVEPGAVIDGHQSFGLSVAPHFREVIVGAAEAWAQGTALILEAADRDGGAY